MNPTTLGPEHEVIAANVPLKFNKIHVSLNVNVSNLLSVYSCELYIGTIDADEFTRE